MSKDQTSGDTCEIPAHELASLLEMSKMRAHVSTAAPSRSISYLTAEQHSCEPPFALRVTRKVQGIDDEA